MVFQHAQNIPTNKANWNGRKRSQTHIYELHNDGRRTHTNWNEFESGPICKYTQVDVGGRSSMCEEAIRDMFHRQLCSSVSYEYGMV